MTSVQRPFLVWIVTSVIVCGAACATSHSAAAPAGDPTVATFSVERPAYPLPDNPPPSYPRELFAKGVEGDVTLEYVVTSRGRVDMKSVTVVSSTDALFTKAVRHVLPRWRYLPAETGPEMSSPCGFDPNASHACRSKVTKPARKYSQTVRQTFHFGPPSASKADSAGRHVR
jgi:TonB family protein